jgi:hypothetical protein
MGVSDLHWNNSFHFSTRPVFVEVNTQTLTCDYQVESMMIEAFVKSLKRFELRSSDPLNHESRLGVRT